MEDIIFHSNITGESSSSLVIKNFTFPVFSTINDSTTYLNKNGLMAFIGGDLYIKRNGVSSPIRLLTDLEDKVNIDNSIKDITNARVSGNNILIDFVRTNNSTSTLTIDASSFKDDVQVTNATFNATNTSISIIESNGDVNTIPLGSLILNYINTNMLDNSLDLLTNVSKYVNRDGLRNIIDNNNYNFSVTPNKGLRKEYIDDSPTISYGEIASQPNILNGITFISKADTAEYGTIITYTANGSYELKSYETQLKLNSILQNVEFNGLFDDGFDFQGAYLKLDADDKSIKLASQRVSDNGLDNSYNAILNNSYNNTLSAINNFDVNNIIQSAIETTITQQFIYENPINFPTSVSDGTLIHKKYVDDNYVKKVPLSGIVSLPNVTKTSNYNLTLNDFTVKGNCSSASLNFYLPLSTVSYGTIYKIKKVDSTTNVLTIVAQNGETIDGFGYYPISIQNNCIELQSNGINGWDII